MGTQNMDIYIDFEWYPYSGELDNFFYLFGYFQIKDNESSFDYFWSDAEDEEKSSLQKFVDYIIEQKQKNPDRYFFWLQFRFSTAIDCAQPLTVI